MPLVRFALILASSMLIGSSAIASPPRAVGSPNPQACAESGTDRPASDSPTLCCVRTTAYSVTATSTRIRFHGVPTFKDGPGGEMEVSRNYSGTATYSVTVGAESEVGAVLAKAKVSISGSLAYTNTTSTTHTYRRVISKGKYGHVQYVSWGKAVNYRKYRRNANCTTTTLARGTIKFPSSEEGWYYWQTSS